MSVEREKPPTPTDRIVENVRRRLARMRAGVITAARYVNNTLIGDDDTWRCSMVTLTYHRAADWAPHHLPQLLKFYRHWFKKRGQDFRYVWCLEVQKRGAPHYHIVMWVKGKLDKNGDWYGERPPFPDKGYGGKKAWWTHGSSNCIWATSPVGYIAKYASKGPGGKLPHGARIWGYGGLDAAGKFELARALAPRWLRKVVAPTAQIKRVSVVLQEARKYGQTAMVKVGAFLDNLTGFTFFSPWLSDGWTPNGLALRHQGYVEALSSEGDWFRIHQPQGTHA
jgi:hypothetical protein